MVWWNPLSWGGDAAEGAGEAVVDAVAAALRGAAKKLAANPVAIASFVAVPFVGKAAWEAAKVAGQEAGHQIMQEEE